ncbi:hypothetical protein RCF19_30090 [Rhodococcus qingshengii]
MSLTLDAEKQLEDEARQRNQQTAADFPPGTVVYVSGDTHTWIVDMRWHGALRLERHIEPGRRPYLDRRVTSMTLPAGQLWRIDPTR